MKKILFAAMAATVLLASCAKEDGAKNDAVTKPMTLVIKNNDLNGTRGVDNVIANKTVTLKTGWVMFLIDGVVDKKLEIVETATDGKVTAADLAAGYTIEEVRNTVDQVVVLANLGSKHNTVGSANNLTTVTWELNDIQATGDLSTVTLWGQGDCNETASVMTATVTVAPIAARIQIPGVKLTDNFSYKLAGVFINNVYTSFNGMSGVDGKINNGTEVLNYVFASYNPAGMADGISTIKDHTTGSFPYDGTKYLSFWAYNVFPATGGSSKIPHIVFHFTDVTIAKNCTIDGKAYTAGTTINNGNVYITISGYESTTAFEAGKIYTITTIDGKEEDDFGTGDGTTPSEPGIEVPDDKVIDEDNKKPETGSTLQGKVTVSVQNWTPATLKPTEW